MACFAAPAAEAIVTTIAGKVIKAKEEKCGHTDENTIRFSQKLGWLNKMLWGGSALLIFEHIWHGEVTAFFPFFTNAASPEGLQEMLLEVGTTGVAMSALVTAVWAVMVTVTHLIEKKKPSGESA